MGFPIEWLDMITERGGELATAFLAGLPQEVEARTDLADRVRGYLTGTDLKSVGWRIGAAFDSAAKERARLGEMREEATRELTRLRALRAELTEEEFERREAESSRDRAEINRLIRSGTDEVAVIRFLTDKGVLPNYAFPEEGVKLTSILSRRNDTGRNDAARGEDGLIHVEFSRPVSSALSEFAPGQFFYANGRQTSQVPGTKLSATLEAEATDGLAAVMCFDAATPGRCGEVSAQLGDTATPCTLTFVTCSGIIGRN